MRRIALGLMALMLTFAATLSAAGGKTAPAPATIELSQPAVASFSGTTDSTIWPAIGANVTFAVTYPKSVEKFGPRIQVMCYQDGSLVYGEAGPWYQAFFLGGSGSLWLYNTATQGAHCVADLYYWSYQGGQKFNWLASTEFDAAGKP